MKLLLLPVILFLSCIGYSQTYSYRVNLSENSKDAIVNILDNVETFNRYVSESEIYFQSTELIIQNQFAIRAQSFGYQLLNFSVTSSDALSHSGMVKAGTDCPQADIICSNDSFSGNNQGFGAQELNASNRGCLLGNEHYSAWYYLNIATNGTLAMTIAPGTSSTDYDFAIWGPFDANTAAANCPPTSAPIRCSFAQIGMGGAPNELTGLGMGATDTSEDSMGDGFVAPLNVTAGQVYILLIDNFSSTNVGYNVTFGGTATLGCDPVVLPVELDNLFVAILGRENHINWATLTETENAYFTIERSTDGHNWRDIYKQIGAGTSSSKHEYRYVDDDFEPTINYYRVSQTDFDGTIRVIGTLSADNRGNKKLLKTVNLLGQEVDQSYKGIVIECYNDGSTVKVIR